MLPISIRFVGKRKRGHAKDCETGFVEHQNQPVVAAFDLDGTLTRGGSVFPWLKFIAGRARTWRAALSLAVPLTIGALRSSRWADHAKERLFLKLLAGLDEQVVMAQSRAFALAHLEHEGRDFCCRAWRGTANKDTTWSSSRPRRSCTSTS